MLSDGRRLAEIGRLLGLTKRQMHYYLSAMRLIGICLECGNVPLLGDDGRKHVRHRLEYDHVRGNCEGRISQIFWRGDTMGNAGAWPLERCMLELEKTELVCWHPCHQVREKRRAAYATTHAPDDPIWRDRSAWCPSEQVSLL